MEGCRGDVVLELEIEYVRAAIGGRFSIKKDVASGATLRLCRAQVHARAVART